MIVNRVQHLLSRVEKVCAIFIIIFSNPVLPYYVLTQHTDLKKYENKRTV